MTDRRPRTRRQLLGLFTGVGALGFLGGAGSYALLRDEERLSGAFTTDGLDVRVAGARGSGTVSEFGDRAVSVQFDGVSPGASGRAAVGIESCRTPADVALRLTATDGSSTALLSALDVTLSVVPPDGGERRLFEGRADDLVGAFGDGVALDGCVGCEATVLRFDWALPGDATVAGETAAVRAVLTGRRCDGATTTRGGGR
ncbi:MAG: hypothetical protein ABEJ82_10205 [Haloplanus sp.]